MTVRDRRIKDIENKIKLLQRERDRLLYTTYNPGPWSIKTDSGITKIVSDDNEQVAIIAPTTHIDGNARLISQAPSAYELLHRLVEYLKPPYIEQEDHKKWAGIKLLVESSTPVKDP